MMMLIYLKMKWLDVSEAAIFIPSHIFPVKTVVSNQALSRETFKVIKPDHYRPKFSHQPLPDTDS